jgi:putative ABC transport system permease protein
VGILKPTGTPNDRTVFVNLNGFFAIDGHEKPIDEAIAREAEIFREPPEEVKQFHAKELALYEKEKKEFGHAHTLPMLQKEVTSILVKMKFDPKNPTLSQSRAIGFSAKLKEGFKAQAVNPIRPMQKLMKNLVGNIRLVLMYLTGLIIIVSGVGIFVSIYNSMADRKKEIAIMRALGADRMTVFSIILTESVTLCLLGGLAGIVMGHGLIMLAGPVITARSGLLIDPFIFDPQELIVIPAMIVLASLVGFIPGLTAYRTDVAENLSS